MLDVDDAFFHLDQRAFIVIVDGDIERRPAYRNHRRRRQNAVRIRLVAEALNVDSHSSHDNIQQIFPIRRILAEDDVGIRKHLKSAPVGNLKHRVAIYSSDDDLFHQNAIANT